MNQITIFGAALLVACAVGAPAGEDVQRSSWNETLEENYALCAHGQIIKGHQKTCIAVCAAGCSLPGCGGFKKCEQIPNVLAHNYRCHCNGQSVVQANGKVSETPVDANGDLIPLEIPTQNDDAQGKKPDSEDNGMCTHGNMYTSQKTCIALCAAECSFPGCGGFKKCEQMSNVLAYNYKCHCQSLSGLNSTILENPAININSGSSANREVSSSSMNSQASRSDVRENTNSIGLSDPLKSCTHGQIFHGQKTCIALCGAGCSFSGCGGFKKCERIPNVLAPDYRCHCYGQSLALDKLVADSQPTL
ncbi:hypothetical protein [Providencia sp. PROV053]|uniref:hypothetical protein n=1 Tax=Providencia sp. PROV053 TaxID=2949781 RepID=UPI00234B11A7|nr:hypothetical protein [Providencia sp. PROV053]